MADVQYEVNLDTFKDSLPPPNLYDGYGNYDLYVNPSALASAEKYLPPFSIDSFGTSLSQNSQEEKILAGEEGGINIAENADGSFSHIVERGDTYWKIAQNIVLSQSGVEDASGVSKAEIAKVMNELIEFNAETRESANHLDIGQEIRIPKEFGDALKNTQEGLTDAATDASSLTEEERKQLNTTTNGIKVAEINLDPVDGTYNPLQPPGFEQGRSGDYGIDGFWNYDIEGREIVNDVTNKFTGMRTLSYKGQVDSGYGANQLWMNDTPFTATENINANGVLTYRHISYQDSSVKMNFDDGTGRKVNDYVRTVENQLDPSSGNYNLRITTVDGKTYSMKVDGQTGMPVKDSIKISDAS